MQIGRFGLTSMIVLSLAFAAGCLADVNVRFSPRGGCDAAVRGVARSATVSLDAACYSFTLDVIASDLVAAERHGVRVRVIMDKGEGTQRSSQAAKLVLAGIPVKINSHPGLMHDKFLVVDGKSVATGSFNWTQAAADTNDENLVVFRAEPVVASAFARQFQKMWTDTARFCDYRPSPPARTAAARSAASTSTRRSRQPVPQVVRSREPRQRTGSSDTVYITKNGAKYHRAGCPYLKGGGTPVTRAEAEAQGYTPCGTCKP